MREIGQPARDSSEFLYGYSNLMIFIAIPLLYIYLTYTEYLLKIMIHTWSLLIDIPEAHYKMNRKKKKPFKINIHLP